MALLNFRSSRGPNDWKWEVPMFLLMLGLLALLTFAAHKSKEERKRTAIEKALQSGGTKQRME